MQVLSLLTELTTSHKLIMVLELMDSYFHDQYEVLIKYRDQKNIKKSEMNSLNEVLISGITRL